MSNIVIMTIISAKPSEPLRILYLAYLAAFRLRGVTRKRTSRSGTHRRLSLAEPGWRNS